MKIDKKKLIELLVNKTGMEKKDVEDQLEELIERILDATKKGKALEIKDFGLFYFDETGDLKFDPADELSTEISFKYAGMKPVEIQPDRDTTIAPDEEDDELDDIFDIPDETEEDIFEEPITDFDDLDIDEETTKQSDQPEPDDDFLTGEETEDEDFDFLSDLPDEEFSQKTEPKTKEKAKPVASTVKMKRTPERRQSNAGIWVVAAILLIGLIAAGVYLWMSGTTTAPQDQQVVVTPQAQPGTQELTDITDDTIQPQETTTPTETETEQEPVPETTVQTGPEPVPAPQIDTQTISDDQPLYGLTGVVNPDVDDSYGIVLHSFTDETTARNTANLLIMEGYRAQVTARLVSNSTMWRVSVGQFETLGEAQIAANSLPTPYNTQNFIHRIQNN